MEEKAKLFSGERKGRFVGYLQLFRFEDSNVWLLVCVLEECHFYPRGEEKTAEGEENKIE